MPRPFSPKVLTANALLEGDVVGPELDRIHLHLVLAHEAADAGHFGDAGDGLQLVAQVPVLDRAQPGEVDVGRRQRGAVDRAGLEVAQDAAVGGVVVDDDDRGVGDADG